MPCHDFDAPSEQWLTDKFLYSDSTSPCLSEVKRSLEYSIASESLRSVLSLFDPLPPTRSQPNPVAEAIQQVSNSYHIPHRSPKLTPAEAFIRPSRPSPYQRTSTLIYVPIPTLD